LISKYFAKRGRKYLKKIVVPLLTRIAQHGNLEIQREKADQSVDVEANATKLLNFAQDFIDNVFASVDKCPL
jgi:hypothetical protein